ncbi:hypothetical protein HG531_001608 [Fusarium graminearum]|nr:hypothetical protein HG531_001608 [Fusarium graminearum]
MNPGGLIVGGSRRHGIGRRSSNRRGSRSFGVGCWIRGSIIVVFRLSGSIDLIVVVIRRNVDGSFRDLDIIIVVVFDLFKGRSLGIRLITGARRRGGFFQRALGRLVLSTQSII